MAVKVVVYFDPRGLQIFDKALQTLGTRQVRTILRQSLGQIGNKAKTTVSRQLVAQTGLARDEVGKALSAHLKGDGLIYEIKGSGRYFGLKDFHAVQRRKGVSARPWNQRRTFPGTFIIEAFGGNVFKRTQASVFGRMLAFAFPSMGKSRLKKLYGPAIPREMERSDRGSQIPAIWDNIGLHELPQRIDDKLRQYMP